MKLQTSLMMLVTGAMAPLLAVAIVGGLVLIRHERDSIEQEAIGRARSAMSAIDAEVHGSLATLIALAASKNLASGDLHAFHEEAQRVLASQPDWLNIGLATDSRVSLLDASRPWGSHAPFGGDDDAFDQAVGTHHAAVGNVRTGTVVSEPAVRIRFPVSVEGTVRYVLSVPIRLASFEEVLRAQEVPQGWMIALTDREGRFIARIPPAPAGTLIADSYRKVIERTPEGWFAGRSLEGGENYTPYVTSELTGWVLGITMPAAIVDAGKWRALRIVSGGLLAALAIAIGLAWFMGRRIARPIVELAAVDGASTNAGGGHGAAASGIDEIARLDEALRDAWRNASERQRKVEEQDRRKDEFLATLAHELRNPLAPLRTALDLLGRHQDAAHAAATPVREIMERQVNQLVRLVDDLLETSRITRGALELRKAPVEVAAIVRSAVETVQPLISARAQGLSVIVPDEPLCLDGDSARLIQVLSNLLSNAAKYTDRGGDILVRAQCDGGMAMICIRDTGAGISDTALPHIFDMFNRGDRKAAGGEPGLGIGLALARRLVEMHDGTISARSEGPGKGSEFVVRLPLTLRPQPAAANPISGESALFGKRILIVDDNRDAADSLGIMLGLLGASVRVEHEGAKTLEAFASHDPQAVLLDIGMPGMDGYEVAERLRAGFPDRRTLLIAITGWGQKQDRERTRAAGFDHHLTKPADVRVIAQLVASSQDWHSSAASTAGRF